MKLLFKLILRDAWYHRARLSLAVLATVAMSCMIVWLIGSLDLMVVKFDEDAENYLGVFHVAMVPGKEAAPGDGPPAPGGGRGAPASFPVSVIDELRRDELVVQVAPALQIRNIMGKMENEDDHDAAVRRQRSITGLPTQSPAIIGIDTAEAPFDIKDGRWLDAGAETAEGVLGTTAAKSLQGWDSGESDPVRPGDTVICRIGTKDFKVKVVGLVEQTLSGGGRGGADPAVGALYVSLKTARQLSPTPENEADRIDFVYVRLREGTSTAKFEETWSKHLASQDIDMKFLDVDKIQDRLNKTRAGGAGALMGGAASLNAIIVFSTLVSILIVFTALSMGVNERTRVFAMLRAVGMSRRKIAFLVFGESVILCFLGWLGGMAAGWFVLQLYVWSQPEVFGTGKTVSLGLWPVVVAGTAALIGSLLSAIFPAWRATRISPLEGMNRGYTQTIKKRWFVVAAVVGALLLVINPVLVYRESVAQGGELRMFLYTFVGLPTQIAGFLLLAPALILLVEKLFTPVVAKALRLPKELLASQLGSNIWRTLGTTLALCVGLGVYCFLEVSGYSMLAPYIQSNSIPDTLVTFLPSGLPPTEIETVRNMPGVDSKRFLPIALDQSRFSERQTDRFLANGLARMQPSAVVFGIDIDEAFGPRADGSRPLFELPFQEGNLKSALEKLKTGGRYCLVPDSFANRAGVHVGDKLELVLPAPEGARPRGGRGAGGRPPGEGGGFPRGGPPGENIVEYEICGVVSIHGWLWMNKISGVRKRGYRSGAMLLAPYETVRNDYKLEDAAYFWFDRTVDAQGKPTVSDTELEGSLQKLADRFTPQTEGVTRSMVKVSSREYLLERVGSRSDQVIQAAAKMPLILLAISSFGMMGTIAASVRSRRYEFGVLRSLGVTRFGLIRLILAEALLIALAVIAISLGFGVLGGWCFVGLMKYVGVFGGFTNPLVIPVYWLSIGLAAALVFCFLAALGPAVAAGRTDPTRLLQER